MWISTPFSWYKLFTSERHAAILVFAFCVVLRAIPELVAYPHPIGYDVVNYYIPVVENFDEHWPTTASQFPLYILLLHFLQTVTVLPAQSVIVTLAIVVFGIFGTSLYYLGRSLLKLGIAPSVFIAAFVVFQMVVLRTAWDLHRDIFALTGMMFAFSLLTRNKTGLKEIAIIVAFAVLVVAADRMIGLLFCISLAAYAIMMWRRRLAVVSIFAVGLFSILMVASYSASDVNVANVEVSSKKTPAFYDSQNLLVLFIVANGLLVAPAIIGFLQIKNYLLKVPLLVSVIGSFSWLIFPDISQLVADRWIILAGIFLSIFAGYGILRIANNLKPRLSIVFAIAVLAAFAVIGIAYAVMPYDNPFVLYSIARYSIENFGPTTMQFNSLDIQDNDELLSSIDWINKNTEEDAIIVGEKHWRGLMEIYLKGEREYRFSDNPRVLAEALERQGKPSYLVTFDSNSLPMFEVEHVAIR